MDMVLSTRRLLCGLLALAAVVSGLVPGPADGESSPSGAVLDVRQGTAMCGVDSPGGTVKCGMNVCCSASGWCGTSPEHCLPANGCQAGFGRCEVVSPPSCNAAARSTDARSVGYYQVVAARDRACDLVPPSQIVTAGYTHLLFSFLSINPTTFRVEPFDARDVPLFTEFTALKAKKVQTWIAIAGYDFSDADKPTHRTWSQMAANATSRAAFICSLVSFMATYGFQGADIDWEWPVDPSRGGSPGDTANLVTLVREMRAAFGTQYGLSMAITPDYAALRYFDCKAMEPYLDFFGFMSYDLHTPSDASGQVQSQTDVRDIATLAKPLWFAGLNPFKINLGLATYGRGFKLADTNCRQPGCPFAGASTGGPCTNSPGVMTLNEIRRRIAGVPAVTPSYSAAGMFKQISWADQWIGYDDADTWAAKKGWADGLCFGGTMVWSTDFFNGTGPNPTALITANGQCGAANGGRVCGSWVDGDCCSSSGWCGGSDAYCGTGCQSGGCAGPPAGTTTDGRCGAGFGGVTCGSWPAGGCCSSGGWCGDSAAHCGAGCQSGCS